MTLTSMAHVRRRRGRNTVHLLVCPAKDFAPPPSAAGLGQDQSFPPFHSLVGSVVRSADIVWVEKLRSSTEKVRPHARGAVFYPRFHALALRVVQEGAVLAAVEVVEEAAEEALVELEARGVLVEELVGGVEELVEDGRGFFRFGGFGRERGDRGFATAGGGSRRRRGGFAGGVVGVGVRTEGCLAGVVLVEEALGGEESALQGGLAA